MSDIKGPNDNELEKGIGKTLVAGAITAGLTTNAAIPNVGNLTSLKEPKAAARIELHPELERISQIESSGGKNKNHAKTLVGVNAGDTAAGSTGLMPIMARETISKNPELKHKYSHLASLSNDAFTDHLNKNPSDEADISNHHWARLDKKFGSDSARKAYAWRNGITAANVASNEKIAAHPYVQKFMNMKASHGTTSKQKELSDKSPKHPNSYAWHDGHTDHHNEVKKSEAFKLHPHLQAHGDKPQATEASIPNDQAGGNKSGEFHNIMNHYGTSDATKPTNLKFYNGLEHYTDKINNHIKEAGHTVYTAGGKFGKPDLANKNYNTKHLMIYDPTEGSGGDFGHEDFTSNWRKIHEKAHADTYDKINSIYGEGRRLGKLGARSPNEMKRAVHWEWETVHRQRELMESMGHKMSDEDFNREANTVMGDAVHRSVTGKFTDPNEMGFYPHSEKVPLEHALNTIDQYAAKMGLRHKHDTTAQRDLAANAGQAKNTLELIKKSLANLVKSDSMKNYKFHEEVADMTDNPRVGQGHPSKCNCNMGDPSSFKNHKKECDPCSTIVATHIPSGRQVGSLSFNLGSKGSDARSVSVDMGHRRLGLATAMYDYVEKKHKTKMSPGDNQLPDAEKFWANRLNKTASMGSAAINAHGSLVGGAALADDKLTGKEFATKGNAQKLKARFAKIQAAKELKAIKPDENWDKHLVNKSELENEMDELELIEQDLKNE